jgi:anhydro-N-acetylmuramic acid kinase
MADSVDDSAPADLYIGLMSGTSLDGVDAVLADFSICPPRTLAHAQRPFTPGLRAELLALARTGPDEIERASRASIVLADLYAECVVALLDAAGQSPASIRAIGAHGQTVRHRPEQAFTVQLNAPARLAERTGIDVVADFRSRDLAAGGQGAPLVPAFHAEIFASPAPRAVINIGGISNASFLRSDRSPSGFDCGPGNVLLDLHAARHLPEPMDRDGAFALSGRIDQPLLARLLAEPYLQRHPPKSTGRELFCAEWLDEKLRGSDVRPADVQRTLTEFTARAIGDAVARWCTAAQDVVVCGGGVRNAALMRAIEASVAPRSVVAPDTLGVRHDQVEALAFAWLARRCLRREPGSVPGVTGARGARVLGAIYPR